MMPRIGSLCSGYGGLELGLMAVVGGSVAWHVEHDKHPSAVLEARFPGVPNYGDVTTTDWTDVEPVDWLTAGYPCQPFGAVETRRRPAPAPRRRRGVTWRRAFCSARRRDGEPCGNPSSDGRGGSCRVHQRVAEERSRQGAKARKLAEVMRAEPGRHGTNVYQTGERSWWWNCPCGEWAGPFRRRMDADEAAGWHDFPPGGAASQETAPKGGPKDAH